MYHQICVICVVYSLKFDFSPVAQLVEQVAVNDKVTGPSPVGGAAYFTRVIFVPPIGRSNF